MRFTRKNNWQFQQELNVNQEELKLIVNARSGMSEDFNTLFSRYQPLVFKIWQQYQVHGLEFDDWLQEAQVVMVRVLKSYTGGDLGKFSGFYKQSLINRILDIYRAQQATKRIPANQLAPLDKECVRIVDYQQSFPDDIVYCRHCLEECLQDYSDFERQVIALLHNGKSIAEIAACLTCSERKVRSALTRCRKKLLRTLQTI